MLILKKSYIYLSGMSVTDMLVSTLFGSEAATVMANPTSEFKQTSANIWLASNSNGR